MLWAQYRGNWMKSSGLCYAGQPRLMVPLLPLIDDSFKEVLEVLGGKV